MKFILLAAVALMALNDCAALQCYRGVTCTNAKGKDIDTKTCAKKTCESGQMCKRTTVSAGGYSAATLGGCEKANSAKCTSNAAGETCFCDSKDFCNGASYGSASVMILFVSLSIFLVAIRR